MSDTKVVKEFINMEDGTAFNVETLETRELSQEEQDKFKALVK